MAKFKGKYTGWTIGRRYFTEEEFKKSHIKKNLRGLSYREYRKVLSRIQHRRKKPTRRRRSYGWGVPTFRLPRF